MASYEQFLEFLGEFELRLWAITRARAKSDYAFVQRAIEDLADRAKGRPTQSLQHIVPGGEIAVRIIHVSPPTTPPQRCA